MGCDGEASDWTKGDDDEWRSSAKEFYSNNVYNQANLSLGTREGLYTELRAGYISRKHAQTLWGRAFAGECMQA